MAVHSRNHHREVVEGLERLQAELDSGEVRCAAIRLFHKDGTHEDVALGGTEEQREKLLADLRKRANAMMH